MTVKSATIRMPQRRGYTSRAPHRGGKKAGSTILSASIRGILVFLTLFLFLGLSVFTSYKVKTVADDISQLESRYAALHQENIRLNSQLDKVTSRATLAKIGKRLGLRPPHENQIVTLPE